MDPQEVEPGEQFTQIKDNENGCNKEEEITGEDGVFQEGMGGSNYGAQVKNLCPISLSQMLEVDVQPPQFSGEGEKRLILLKTVQLKIEDDVQQDGPTYLQNGLQGLLSPEVSLLPPVDVMPQSVSIPGNSEEGLAVNFLERIYTVHRVEAMPVNSLKEASAFDEDKRSARKTPDVLWIKVDRSKDIIADEGQGQQLSAAEEERINNPLVVQAAKGLGAQINAGSFPLPAPENKDQGDGAELQQSVSTSTSVPLRARGSRIRRGGGTKSLIQL
uniref:Uncharacterized protein n=1 Tax=Sphaerodactylus townsendi TaxID=933632 RepID=A0ACB8F6Q5_9SAUR